MSRLSFSLGPVIRTAAEAFLFFLASAGLAAVSINLAPPYVEKVIRPGTTINDTISYTNNGDVALDVSVELADFQASAGGKVLEKPPGTDPASLAGKIRISPTRVRVAPGQQVFFRYSVDPGNNFTQLRAMVYFLSRQVRTRQGETDVAIAPRLGIPVYIESTQARPGVLRVESVQWSRALDQPDTLLLKLTVANEGERNVRPTGFVQVTAAGRTGRNFAFNDGRSPVLPGQRREWEMPFGPVPSGELAVALRFSTSARSTFSHTYRVEANSR